MFDLRANARCDVQPDNNGHVNIVEGTTAISVEDFRDCTSLVSIQLPTTLTKIGAMAFQRATALKNVTFTDHSTLQEIGSYGFYECKSLVSIQLPASLTKIGWGAFYGATVLKNVIFTDGSAFQEIGDLGFYKCASLVSIQLPASLTTIGGGAFYGSTALKNVTFTDGSALQEIGDGAFGKCTSLVSIQLPASLTKIGKRAFAGTNLRNINIPASVSIGHKAFTNNGCAQHTEYAANDDDEYKAVGVVKETIFDKVKAGDTVIECEVEAEKASITLRLCA